MGRTSISVCPRTDVKKVAGGYGGYCSARARHTDHTKPVVMTLVVVPVLGAVIGAPAAAT